MQTEYQEELLDRVVSKMGNLGNRPELLSQVIVETLDGCGNLIGIVIQEGLDTTTSELYGCTVQQAAFSVLDYQLGQDYLVKMEENKDRYDIYDDTFNFVMTDNNGHALVYDSIEEAEEEIHGWFSQQDDTESFTIFDCVKNVSVKTIERGDE